MMSDIRESGRVEQDADVILFLFRESYYDKDTDNHTLEIIFSKNRNGPVESISVNYNDLSGRIEDQKESIQNNVLGFHKVGIYSLKMNQKEFVFIFAASKQESMQLYTKTFHQNPLNCHAYLLDYQLARGNEVISFREMRKEFISFPAIAGYFKREW
ncbi:DnaB-like helicase C-terminal domain-containing protein [Neobacillus drentensis]|uniref:DnaB-like helicase C-terminal domain-containing protein n=1 Tax=Neobacillus drentensis TaxID=220684 RepID=UPI003B5888F6